MNFKKTLIFIFAVVLSLPLLLVKVNAEDSSPLLDEGVVGGLKFSYEASGTGFSWFRSLPTITDWSGAESLEIRICNATGANSPLQLSLHDVNATIFATNQDMQGGPQKAYGTLLDGTTVDVPIYWGNIWIPASFNGVISIPLTSFNKVQGETSLQLDSMYALFIGTDLKYNAFEKILLGSLAIKKTNGEVFKVLDYKTLTQEEFTNQIYADEDENSQKVILEVVESSDVIVPKPATFFGDFKLLENFNYDEKDLKTTFVVWSGGADLTVSSYADGYTGNAMQVDIGNPALTQNYGSIDIGPSPYVNNWSIWNDGGSNHDQDALGFSFWVKNLSSREITINLEFDEFNEGRMGPNGEDYTNERFNIKYGARILLQDVNGNEFIVQSKPVFAIPVGFEGFVRIPFTEYQVPEWCNWSDFSLDLEHPISKIFLTTDASVNTGLSFAFDQLGVYYNHTEIDSLFNPTTKSINDNMGISG